MKFSTSIEYAIHGLAYLARFPADRSVLVSNVAKAIRVPETYLRKVFLQLSRGGILTSQRGARGGFRLSRPAEQINLKHVVEVVDGSLPVYSCLSVVRDCRLQSPCPVHKVFEEARLKMAEVLESTSIKDLVGDITQRRPSASWLKVTA